MGKLIVNLTHDVDRVKKTYQYLTQNLAKGKLRPLKQIFKVENPYWCFDRIIEVENRYNIRSTFFFLEESMKLNLFKPSSWFLSMGRYRFRDKAVADIIRKLDAEGWEIGLHGSYFSYKNPDLLKDEKKKLEQILGKTVKGIRQHHLNLDIPQTWKYQKEAGFDYDASYGKKRGIGFLDKKIRPFIDSESKMFIIPLTFMEFNLVNEASGDIDKAHNLLIEQINIAENNGSVLSVIWHQRMFNGSEFPGYYYLYETLIKECKERGAQFKTCSQIYNDKILNTGE